MPLSFCTDVVVSTLAPDGADPAASAAASIGSSLRQQSSQSAHSSHSAHSSRSRARSRAGSSSSRSRARSTIEEEVTAEQRMGKAIGLAALLGSVAVRNIFLSILSNIFIYFFTETPLTLSYFNLWSPNVYFLVQYCRPLPVHFLLPQ